MGLNGQPHFSTKNTVSLSANIETGIDIPFAFWYNTDNN